MMQKGINANQLKSIAILAMTANHLTWVIFPGYSTDLRVILVHILGRLAAPIFWFFIAEGYHYTHNLKKYAIRLSLFSLIGHFAYNFAFGIPFLPFRTSIFNQTSVIWSLFWGLIALTIMDNTQIRQWQKAVLLLGITVITFCSDWSCIAVMAILHLGQNRGNFKTQMTGMMMWVAAYALVYAVFIDPVYGILQLFVALTIPLLKRYNGCSGHVKGMKWLFYIYYPLHLILCGWIRISLHGNSGVMIGGQ